MQIKKEKIWNLELKETIFLNHITKDIVKELSSRNYTALISKLLEMIDRLENLLIKSYLREIVNRSTVFNYWKFFSIQKSPIDTVYARRILSYYFLIDLNYFIINARNSTTLIKTFMDTFKFIFQQTGGNSFLRALSSALLHLIDNHLYSSTISEINKELKKAINEEKTVVFEMDKINDLLQKRIPDDNVRNVGFNAGITLIIAYAIVNPNHIIFTTDIDITMEEQSYSEAIIISGIKPHHEAAIDNDRIRYLIGCEPVNRKEINDEVMEISTLLENSLANEDDDSMIIEADEITEWYQNYKFNEKI